MITFHPAARPVSTPNGNGFVPMVTLRKSTGHMVGSKSQTGNVFATAVEAKAHALIIALRAAMTAPDMLTVCR